MFTDAADTMSFLLEDRLLAMRLGVGDLSHAASCQGFSHGCCCDAKCLPRTTASWARVCEENGWEDAPRNDPLPALKRLALPWELDAA